MKVSHRRLTIYWLFSSLPLLFNSGTAAQSLSGVQVQGAVALHGPQGDEQGVISIEVADAAHCRVTITLGPEVLHREYTAVLNGKLAQVSGPAGLVTAAPLPVSPALGCALLPAAIAGMKLAGIGASLQADPTGAPTGLSWKTRGRAAQVSYGDYAAAGSARSRAR